MKLEVPKLELLKFEDVRNMRILSREDECCTEECFQRFCGECIGTCCAYLCIYALLGCICLCIKLVTG